MGGGAMRQTGPRLVPRRVRLITLPIDDPALLEALERAHAQASAEIEATGGRVPGLSDFIAQGLLPLALRVLARARAPKPEPHLVVLPEEVRRDVCNVTQFRSDGDPRKLTSLKPEPRLVESPEDFRRGGQDTTPAWRGSPSEPC